MKQYCRLLVGVFVALLVGSCAFNQPHGPTFTGVQNAADGSAVIYFYRPGNEDYGYNLTYTLHVSDAESDDLRYNHWADVGMQLHGGYIRFVTTPGKKIACINMTFENNSVGQGMVLPDGSIVQLPTNPGWVQCEAQVKFTVESNTATFVRFHPINRWNHFEPSIFVVTQDVGGNELVGTKLEPGCDIDGQCKKFYWPSIGKNSSK